MFLYEKKNKQKQKQFNVGNCEFCAKQNTQKNP